MNAHANDHPGREEVSTMAAETMTYIHLVADYDNGDEKNVFVFEEVLKDAAGKKGKITTKVMRRFFPEQGRLTCCKVATYEVRQVKGDGATLPEQFSGFQKT